MSEWIYFFKNIKNDIIILLFIMIYKYRIDDELFNKLNKKLTF